MNPCANNKIRVPKEECVCQPLKCVRQVLQNMCHGILGVWEYVKLEIVCQIVKRIDG